MQPDFKKPTAKQLLAHSKQEFQRQVITEGLRSRKGLQLYVYSNKEKNDPCIIGIKEPSWLGLKGFESFVSSAGLLTSLHVTYQRRNQSLEWSSQNVEMALTAKARKDVCDVLRLEVATNPDMQDVANRLNKANVPSESVSGKWSPWLVRAFCSSFNLWTKKENT